MGLLTKRTLKSPKGAGAAEYVLLCSVISIGLMSVVSTVSDGAEHQLEKYLVHKVTLTGGGTTGSGGNRD